MSRRLKVSSAQLGPIHLADSRASVVKRMVEMLKEADSRGSKFVVFPELALTTFFPRYWMDDPNEVEKYFENQMPSPETAPLFELARSKGIGFYLGYAERTEEGGKAHHFNTSILVGPDGRLIGKYRKVHLPGHDDHRPNVLTWSPYGAFRAMVVMARQVDLAVLADQPAVGPDQDRGVEVMRRAALLPCARHSPGRSRSPCERQLEQQLRLGIWFSKYFSTTFRVVVPVAREEGGERQLRKHHELRAARMSISALRFTTLARLFREMESELGGQRVSDDGAPENSFFFLSS